MPRTQPGRLAQAAQAVLIPADPTVGRGAHSCYGILRKQVLGSETSSTRTSLLGSLLASQGVLRRCRP